MFEFDDGGRLVANQDVDDLVFLELLLDGLNHLHGQHDEFGCVHLGLRVVAVVAVVATLRLVRLAEIMEQVLAAAAGGFRIRRGLGQQLVHHLLLGHRLLVGKILQFVQVLVVVEGDAKALAVVTTGTTRFLIVAFQTLRHVVVDDEAHIRLVDAHTEGDGGHDDVGLLHQEVVLVLHAGTRIQTGMIRQRADLVHLQKRS